MPAQKSVEMLAVLRVARVHHRVRVSTCSVGQRKATRGKGGPSRFYRSI